MNNNDHLKFPTGRTVARVKKDAKAFKKEQGISHREALDKMARTNGLDMNWSQAISHLRTTRESFSHQLSSLLNSGFDGSDQLSISTQHLADKLFKTSTLTAKKRRFLKNQGIEDPVTVTQSLTYEGRKYSFNKYDLRILKFIVDLTVGIEDGVMDSDNLQIIVGSSPLEYDPAYLIFPKKFTNSLSAFKSVRESFERLSKLSIYTSSTISGINEHRSLFHSIKFDRIKRGPSFTVEIHVGKHERLYCKKMLMTYDKASENT